MPPGARRTSPSRSGRKEADFLLCVKGNQPDLEAAVERVFDRACEADFVGVEHDGHEVIKKEPWAARGAVHHGDL